MQINRRGRALSIDEGVLGSSGGQGDQLCALGVATHRYVAAMFAESSGEMLVAFANRGLFHLQDDAFVKVPGTDELVSTRSEPSTGLVTDDFCWQRQKVCTNEQGKEFLKLFVSRASIPRSESAIDRTREQSALARDGKP